MVKDLTSQHKDKSIEEIDLNLEENILPGQERLDIFVQAVKIVAKCNKKKGIL